MEWGIGLSLCGENGEWRVIMCECVWKKLVEVGWMG